MIRMIFSVAFALNAATPVLADAKHEETCVETTKIVQIAVTQRAGGMDMGRVKRGLTEGKNKVGERFVPTVGPLVDWVFSIDGSEVKAPSAPEAISGKYWKDCMAFKP